jgi:hypothetical protein
MTAVRLMARPHFPRLKRLGRRTSFMIRFLAMHPMQMMYEVRSPTLDRLRMTLKAVLEPMTMSEIRTVKTTVTVQALSGMSMPGRTCKSQSGIL